MNYYLTNTGKQFDDKIRYIKEGAIAVRHNVELEDFFSGQAYEKSEMQKQLTYCFDLFSQRNMVEQKLPFVNHIYVFNNQNEFVRSNYYPTTLEAAAQTDAEYWQLYQVFKASKSQYRAYPGRSKTDLCFRILNDKMQMVGVGIASIQNDSISSLFSSMKKYQNSYWLVTDSYGSKICGVGTEKQISQLTWRTPSTAGTIKLDGRSLQYQTCINGFGVRTVLAIDESNIYAVLKPMFLLFTVVMVLVLFVVTIIVVGVSYRLTRPLKQIAAEIKSFGREDLSIRMRDFSVQEFHDISVLFNEMIARISRLTTQVYEKELLANRAQIKFLQAQLNPHFQFNILAMFSIKARLSGNEELYQGLHAFSKLMQGKIFREKEIKIPLATEIELVEFYLYLQKSRFPDKISYEINLSGREIESCLIPRLLIEPLVENAVSHGLEPKCGKGSIKIDVREKEDWLYITVEDDGVGFNQETDLQTSAEKAEHTATGLANTIRLLKILYEDSYDIKIVGKVSEGTRVEIVLPVERGEQHVESDCG